MIEARRSKIALPDAAYLILMMIYTFISGFSPPDAATFHLSPYFRFSELLLASSSGRLYLLIFPPLFPRDISDTICQHFYFSMGISHSLASDAILFRYELTAFWGAAGYTQSQLWYAYRPLALMLDTLQRGPKMILIEADEERAYITGSACYLGHASRHLLGHYISKCSFTLMQKSVALLFVSYYAYMLIRAKCTKWAFSSPPSRAQCFSLMPTILIRFRLFWCYLSLSQKHPHNTAIVSRSHLTLAAILTAYISRWDDIICFCLIESCDDFDATQFRR